ncbi:hypothetical protein FQZ97_834290 [compost metagenome]
MFIDPLAMQILVVLDELKGLNQCAVLSGRLQLQQVTQAKQQRAMRFEVFPDQGQVVIAAGGLYFGTGLPQPIEIAVGAEVLPNQAAGFLVVWLLGQNLQDTAQGGDQLFHLLALPDLDLL